VRMRKLCAVALSTCMLVVASSVSSEELELTHCYSGTGSSFSHGTIALSSWNSSGILSSNHPKKLLHSAVIRCEGIQRGGGPTRIGDGYCKIVDEDGDAIIAQMPYVGFDYDVKFLEGTGKWTGVTGSLRSTRLVRSPDGKGAMPGTFQGCRLERGQFELPK
jgi:hypothetical protein